MKSNVKYPCRGCIYFNSCGSNMRTEVCKGRALRQKSQYKNKIIR